MWLKNNKKKILIIVIIIIVLWITIVLIDSHQFYEVKKPLFAIQTSDNSYTTEYKGLGYTIHITKGRRFIGFW